MKKWTIILLTFLFSLFYSEVSLYAKNQLSYTMTEKIHLPEWAVNGVIYEVNIRQYTPEGTLKAFEAHLFRLRELGVNILWLMPVFPIGELDRKGSLGSYYSIRDYYSINPQFGSMQDFDRLIAKAHALGFKVILDWVANHTAHDHTWVQSHPNFYLKDSTGAPAIPVDNQGHTTDWTDVIDLDYSNVEMRDSMRAAMMFWVDKHKIDGFRCDIAGFVPLDFWQSVHQDLEQRGEYLLLGESEQSNYFNDAFQIQYGWSYFHLWEDIAKGKRTADSIDSLVMADEKNSPQNGLKMLFIDNHDENSWNHTMAERFGQGFKTFAVLAFTLPGIPLVYSGQESDLNKSLRFFEKDTIPFGAFSSSSFYQKLIDLRQKNQALWSGEEGGKYTLLCQSLPHQVFAFRRMIKNQSIVIITNLSDQEVTFSWCDKQFDSGVYEDAFSGNNVELSDYLNITLKPWEYRIYLKIN